MLTQSLSGADACSAERSTACATHALHQIGTLIRPIDHCSGEPEVHSDRLIFGRACNGSVTILSPV